MMLRIVHLASAVLLLLAHGAVLFRGLHLRRTGRGPAAIDRAARTLSQLLLPLTALIGLLLYRTREPRPLLLSHLLLGRAPLAAILLVSAGRLLLRKRTEAPWLLPALTLALLGAALATGLALAAGAAVGTAAGAAAGA